MFPMRHDDPPESRNGPPPSADRQAPVIPDLVQFASHEVEFYGGDVTVERVPVPTTPTGKEYDDDDPALLRARDGRYWMAWVGYKTRARDELTIEGADEVFVSKSSDGAGWSAPRRCRTR